MRPAAIGVALALALGLVSGCAGSTASQQTLTVSAASSLTEVFTALAADFEQDHPGVDVALNFAGSSALAEQVNAGAPVDVLATASPATMATVVDAGNATDPTVFATNRLAIVVPTGNPAGITRLADLADPDVQTAICAPDVPCGAATERLLSDNAIDVRAATLDPDVKSVLGRVVSGDVDAGIVYVTDARAAGDDVESVDLPDDINVETDYLIAAISDSGEPALAQEFIDLVTGPSGAQALDDAGFGTP